MAKAQFNPSTGKLKFNPRTGKVIMAKAAPPLECSSEGDSCVYCPGLTHPSPSELEATFTGIIVCTECTYYDTGLWAKWSFETDPNDTWTLTQQVDTCKWSYTAINMLHVERYTNNDCTSYLDNFDANCEIRVRRALINIVVDIVSLVGPGHSIFSNGSEPPDSCCVNKTGLANLLSCGNSYVVADSGSVDIVETV